MTEEQKKKLEKIVDTGLCDHIPCERCPLYNPTKGRATNCEARTIAARALLAEKPKREKWVPCVGERVAVYSKSRMVGQIVSGNANAGYVVSAGCHMHDVHRRQLRRLVRRRKERREWTLARNPLTGTLEVKSGEWKNPADEPSPEVIRVREVPRKAGA